MYTAGRNYAQTFCLFPGQYKIHLNSYKLTASMFVDFWQVAGHRITEKSQNISKLHGFFNAQFSYVNSSTFWVFNKWFNFVHFQIHACV